MNATKGLKRIPVVNIQMVKEKNVYYKSKRITSPQEGFEFFRQYLDGVDREHFVVACLNTKNEVIAVNTVHIGALNASIVHPRETFKAAILANSAGIICAHNHPSGSPEPSKEDCEITKRLFDAGKIIGINLLDHLVIGDTKFVSLNERGYIH